jgi:hypothetical protein
MGTYKERVRCQVCEKSIFDLDAHLEQEHKLSRKEYDARFPQIECPICKRKFQSLRRHISGAHAMTIEAFRVKFPDAPMITEKVAKVSGENGSAAWTTERKKAQAKRAKKNLLRSDVMSQSAESVREFYRSDKGREVARQRWMKRLDEGGLRDLLSETITKRNQDPEFQVAVTEGKKKFFASEEGRKVIEEAKKKHREFYASPAGIKVRKQASERMRRRWKNGEIKGAKSWLKGHVSCKGTELPYRSQHERAAIVTLDKDKNVKTVSYESLRIGYIFEGKERTYIPDFFVTLVNGEIQIIEVKNLTDQALPKNKEKFKAATKFCEDRGWKFLVWDFRDVKEHLPPNLRRALETNHRDLVDTKSTDC